MRVYATAADLAAYPGGDTIAAADADALLRTASRAVDHILVGRVYDVDTVTELPTDTDVAQALNDATCAIAVEAASTGVLEAGATQQWESVSIGNVSLSAPKGASATDSPRVLGLPVPAAAIIALQDVGTRWVQS